MFVIYGKGKMKVPVRVWLRGREDLEGSYLGQAYHLSQLPLLHKWVSLMPDTHTGMGVSIEGVIVANGMVIPNAAGVDTGCDMAYTEANIKVADIREVVTDNGSLFQVVIDDIMRNVPVGFAHRKATIPSYTMDGALEEMDRYEKDGKFLGQLEAGYCQIDVLGGENHSIELQEDDDGYLAVMIHSGSRHFGKSVYNYFHYKAKQLNQKWFSAVPGEYRLAFLPVDTREDKQYLNWMQLSMDFTKENRGKMMLTVKTILGKWVGEYTELSLEFSHDINCHHNHASFESHYGEDVWIHRKGAVGAQNGELAIIPGAMGSYSYVIMREGNQESFCSSPHEAGRQYPRKGAMAAFSYEKVILDLQEQGMILGKKGKADVAGENRFAYKNIEEAMDSQQDLVVPVKYPRTVGVVKG